MSNKAVKCELLPKRRFPEFREEGEWEVKPLGKICDVLNYRRKPITSSDRVSGPYPYYGASGVVDYVNDFIFDERLLLIGEDGAKWGAYEKTAFIVEGKYWVNNHAHVLKPMGVKDTLLENYLTMLDLGPYVTGAAPPKLTLGKLKEVPVPVPPRISEQQKIADCLASLDELITVEAQKLNTVKTHKKGLMQKLFPAEGETLPKLRFREFRDAGEWEMKRLEDFATIVRGGSPRPIDEYITNGPNGLNWLKIGDIDKESKYVTCTQEKVIPAALNKTRVVSPGDLIISNSMSFGRPYILEIKTCIHDGWIAVSEIDKNLDRDYLYYLMMTSGSQTYFSNNAAGSGVQNLNADIIKLLSVSYPRKKEQQKIASCLASLDDLITAQTQKLTALKTHKQGLMQQLFPALDEVPA